jgi:hypothetical protein
MWRKSGRYFVFHPDAAAAGKRPPGCTSLLQSSARPLQWRQSVGLRLPIAKTGAARQLQMVRGKLGSGAAPAGAFSFAASRCLNLRARNETASHDAGNCFLWAVNPDTVARE